MANYISSNANRFYVATEASYGQAAPVSTAGTRNREAPGQDWNTNFSRQLEKRAPPYGISSTNLSYVMDGVCGAFVRSTVSRCARRPCANQ
jgi:hypothetical protein